MDRADITPEELKGRLDRGEKPRLLDIRVEWETQICKLPGAMLVPMQEVQDWAQGFDRSLEVVVYCHHGIRSARVAVWLREQGFAKAVSLAGGIAGWAETVDPKMAKY